MDSGQMMQSVGSFLLGALFAAGGMYAWLSQRLKRERQRTQQVDQARLLVAQQVTQARKQIEQLQRDCHELKLAVRPAPRAAPAPEAPVVDAAEAVRRYAEARPEPAEKPQAFKDTVVLRRGAD